MDEAFSKFVSGSFHLERLHNLRSFTAIHITAGIKSDDDDEPARNARPGRSHRTRQADMFLLGEVIPLHRAAETGVERLELAQVGLRPHPEEHLHLRLHRARSVVLTPQELVEIRAAQRTFEGAYIRTALGQFSFALIILKVFTSEFYAIGALFAVYGVAVMLVAIYRRYEGNHQFFSAAAADGSLKRKFRTSGNSVALLTLLSLSAYITLMVLTWRLVS
ncbi:hypothetical protein G7046_g3284 [Stylonectria norvegica]|nr:hypothetical protein G7046_g3284 [Stylonectria norvegica]